MPISSSSIYFDRLQPGGRRKIAFFMTDDLGVDYIIHKGRVPSGYDEVAGLAAAVNQQNNNLASLEAENAIDRVEAGEDSLTVANAAHHGTYQRIAKKLHRYALREESLYPMLHIETLVEDIKTTYSGDAPGRRTFLNFNINQMQNFNKKYNAAINSKADLILADIQEDVNDG